MFVGLQLFSLNQYAKSPICQSLCWSAQILRVFVLSGEYFECMQKHGHFKKEYSSLQHNFLIFFFSAALRGLSLGVVSRGYFLVAVRSLFFVVAYLVVERRL